MEARTPGRTPPGYPLYVVYAIGMAVLYVACMAGGAYVLTGDVSSERYSEDELRLQGAIFLAVGAPLFLLFAAAPFVARRPWGWVYGLVMICIGLTSCCTWPITIPLLLRWIKPEMKARFGKS